MALVGVDEEGGFEGLEEAELEGDAGSRKEEEAGAA